jgi:hypothetical protein
MNRTLAIISIAALLSTFARATSVSDTSFSQGNTAYVAATNATDADSAKAAYRKAAENYNAAIEAGDRSWAAYYNLGNAYFKLGDYGNAVLDYERAYVIDPVKPETEANMAKAREAAGLPSARAQGKIEAWGTSFPMRWFMWAGAVGGWAFLAAFILPFLYGRHRLATIAASIATLALFGTCVVGMYAWHIHAKWRIVTHADTPMLAAPDEKASVVRKLGPATGVKLVRAYDNWIFVKTEQGDEGWLTSQQAPSIWTERQGAK